MVYNLKYFYEEYFLSDVHHTYILIQSWFHAEHK